MDILEYIKQMQEIYGDKVIITADKLEKPPKTVFREMFQNAFTDNKADGGRAGYNDGQLVTPSVDGSRPGYNGKDRVLTDIGKKRAETKKQLDEYFKNKGKIINKDDLYKKIEDMGFNEPNKKIDSIKKTYLKGKTLTKKTFKKFTGTKMDPDQLKELDKYAKYLKKQGVEGMGDTYVTSTEKAQQSIYNRAANRNFKFTLDKEKPITDTYTELQKNKLKKAFNISDEDFVKSNTQYGVPSGSGVKGEVGKEQRRIYAIARDFVKRGFKVGSQTLPSGELPESKQMPLDKQTEIKTKYELPENYIDKKSGKREWNFKKYPYGVPIKGDTEKMAKKILYEFVRDPKTKKFKFVGDFKTPNGWMMAQMYRSGVEQKSPNYKPLYGKINNVKKIVGFTDNIVGEDFYVRDEFVKPGGKPMRLHPDFDNVEKFVDIANKANAPLNDTLKGLLKKIGVEDNRITMTTLLNYLAKEEGYNATNRALVLHHKGGVFANATKDLQLLRNINNSAIEQAEIRIRNSVNLNQTPDKADIKLLKDNKARVTVGGQTFGSGPQTAKGAFRSYEKFLEGKLKKNEINPKALIKQVEKDYAKLSTNKRCKFNSGGPANLAFCAKEGKKRLEQIILKGGAKEGEQELAKKILQAGRGLRGMVSLSGMFGPAATAFLVGTEAGLVGYDMISQGKTFREVVGDSVFNYALGDRTKIDPKEERYKGYAAAGVDKDTIGKISAFENAMDEVKNMQQEFEKEDVAYRDAVTGGPRISGAIKQKQIKNYYDQVKKNQELIKYLEQPQTQEKLKIVDDDLFPAMLTDADAKRKAMQMTKPLTVGFGNTMDFLFPKATYREDRERAINYMPAVQEYYRGGQFASGGLASLTDTIPPESGPMSQGLRSLYNNDMDY